MEFCSMGQGATFIASGCNNQRVRTRRKLRPVAVAKSFVEKRAKKSPERGILGDLHLKNLKKYRGSSSLFGTLRVTTCCAVFFLDGTKCGC